METLKLKSISKLKLFIYFFLLVLFFVFLANYNSWNRFVQHLIFGVIPLLLGITLDMIQSHTYALAFSSEFVEESYSILYKKRSLKLKTDQITSVDYRWDGRIVIRFHDGKFIQISHRDMLGGIKEVVRVVKLHIPAQLIDQLLLRKAKQVEALEDQFYKGAYIIFSILPVFIVVTALLPFISVGWHVFGRWGFDEVTALSVKQNGSIWVATNNRGGAAKMHFYENGSSTTYPVPDPVDDYAFSNAAIISDVENNPTVLTEDVNYTLQNGVWEQWNFRTEQYQQLQTVEFVNTENEIWMIIRSQGQNSLIHVLAGEKVSTVIPFPDDREDQRYAQALAISPRGVVAVLIADDKKQEIFLLENGVWLSQSYPVEVEEAFYIQDIAIDSGGDVYVLISSPFYEKVVLRKYTPTGSFETYFIEEKNGRSIDSVYNNLLLDSRNRLWLFSRFNDDGTILVLEPVWGEEARELVHYNSLISNYKMSMHVNKPQLTLDGRIWVLGPNLAWIDTTVDTLPQSLPLILRHFVERKGAYFLGLLALQVILLVYWHNKFANEFTQITDKK
jgi:hypothetical protein